MKAYLLCVIAPAIVTGLILVAVLWIESAICVALDEEDDDDV